MAVLVEGLSVVVRRDAIDDHLIGGWPGFVELVPNDTMCTDEELVRVGFLHPDAVRTFIEALEERGLVFQRSERAVHLSVVDQQNGPTVTTSWLQYAHLKLSGDDRKVATCWLFDGPQHGHGLHMKGKQMSLATPPGWRYEESLSAGFEFRPLSREHDA